MLTSSKGYIEIYDIRQSNKTKPVTCTILDRESKNNEFGEIINSITSAKFIVDDGDHWLASRDYLNVKIWDLRKPNYPLLNLRVHDHLNGEEKLKRAYDDDRIFDRFDL